MPLLDGRLADERGGRSGAEIVLDIGFQRRLVALEGEQVIGIVGNDLVGNLHLAAHRIDGDQRPFRLAVFGEVIEEIGDGGDLVGFLGKAALRQDQPGGVGVGAQRVQCLETLTLVMGSTRRLAVDGDQIVPPGHSDATQLLKQRAKRPDRPSS